MAAAKPARPAPTTIAPVCLSGGVWGGEGESCVEDWGLNLNRLGAEERKKEGFVHGRESVMVVIGIG